MRSYEAFIKYLPAKYPGNAALFISQSTADKLNGTALGWEKLICDQLEVIHVPGDHESMVQPPNIESLARNIERLLEKALPDSPLEANVKVRVSERR
jgi:thioesterase domain-containing protein